MTKFSAPQQNQLAQIGAFLRENREKQEKSLEDIAIRTYIRPQLLNGIETGNPDTLPEPIFVQGFIRRYGEALGLNGIELSQQFTVASIPATPRPAPPAPLTDTPTTRLTRASAAQASATAAPVSPSIPIITAKPQSEDLTLGRIQPQPVAASVTSDYAASDDTDAVTTTDFESTVSGVAEAEIPAAANVDNQLDETSTDMVQPAQEANTEIPIIGSSLGAVESSDAGAVDGAIGGAADNEEQDFSSMVAAFDKENLGAQPDLVASSTSETTHLEVPEPEVPELDTSSNVAPVSLNEPVLSEGNVDNARFDDDLPAAFTTEAAAVGSSSTSPQASSINASSDIDYESNQPNLKPFVLGGVLAAIALLGVLIASVIGGNRQPSVANNPEPVEQVEEGDALPPLPEDEATEEPEAVETPAISDAPIYVEATAVREAWVSIIADGETIFEEILQPGDSQLWEAQESLSIYSGDAGALELAANGEDAEVMGAPGQPDEKVFP